MMKKYLAKIFKSLGISIVAVILVTIGINASDHYNNLSESIVGKLILDEPKNFCPDDMVFILSDNGGFCIDKYEVSADPKCPYLNPDNQTMTKKNLDDPNCYPVSIAGAVPWRNISQIQAMTACAKAGKRLPTNEEWFLAALGTPDLHEGWSINDCHVASNWKTQPGLTGTGIKCVSSAGAYDMIGNVWEWVKGEIKDGVYKGNTLPSSGYIQAVDINGLPIESDDINPNLNYNEDYLWLKNKGIRGISRGGYWNNKSDAGLFSVYLVSRSSFSGAGVGFRCAK